MAGETGILGGYLQVELTRESQISAGCDMVERSSRSMRCCVHGFYILDQ